MESISKKILFVVFILTYKQVGIAQVVHTDPNYATETDSITVFFDATQGDMGLMDYQGDIWSHTGVITSNSTHSTDWRYVKTNWGENTSETQLISLGNNLWKLNIGFPHEYYGAPNNEQILQLAFVFRNHDGSESGRDVGGADIFLDLFDMGINTIIVYPLINNLFGDSRRTPLFYQPVDTVHVMITGAAIGTEIDSLELLMDENIQLQTNDDTLSAHILLQDIPLGMHLITAVTHDTSGLRDSIEFSVMLHNEPTNIQRPSGTQDGINYSDANLNSVTLSLFAPYKEFIYVIGDFNNWFVDESYYMHMDSGSADSIHYWLTLDNLSPGTEYAFQYVVDGEIRIADPYTDKVLDKWNDHQISDNTYPNLKPYPFGLTEHIVSVLQTAQTPFDWGNSDSFFRPDKDQLIIYELLLRDFISQHDFQTLTDTLNYLEDLGINAIELMPFNEFEGNSSWGYNTSFYFAPDKYYGPKMMLKSFIDECHRRGIAVIMDMVLNHSYSQSPFVRLYNHGEWGAPTDENPWYNPESNFSNPDAQWGNDFNHESIHTKQLVDRINRYWIEEYRIDGFRFDFTKGFGNNPKLSSDPWGSQYDADRIGLLKRMADQIWEADSTIYIILEHFAENSEEIVLADYGMLLWGNSQYNYAEASMGYHSNGKSDFSWGYYGSRGWDNPHLVTFFESHDEERLMYKNLTWGNSSGAYNIKNLNTAINRAKAIGSFFFTIPGPKMIWQFGELGYDTSINDPCRLCEKPILWDYFDNMERKKLYKTFQALIHLRQQYPIFNSSDTEVDLYVGSSTGKKRIRLSFNEKKAVIIGNFNVVHQSIDPEFFHTGMWYDYFTGDSIDVTDINDPFNLNPGEFHILSNFYLDPPEENLLTTRTENVLLPNTMEIKQNYPNPFNPSTFIEISGNENKHTCLQIFDINGKLIDTLMDESFVSGIQTLQWDASSFPSGIYIARISSGSIHKSIKMLLVK